MAVATNKRYDPKLKEKHDPEGKAHAVEIMRDLAGAKLACENIKEDNGDFSDGFWDQLYELPDGSSFKVEPEMKDSKWFGEHFTSYNQYPFKYQSVDIPFRKAKNKAKVFLVISMCGEFAFVVTRTMMDKALASDGGKPKIKSTFYKKNEPFFSVPCHMGYFVKKANGRWYRWKKD